MRDTIDMAREAELVYLSNGLWWMDSGEAGDELKAFEALVRADERNRTWTQEHWTEYERSIAEAEREACAKVCEDDALSSQYGERSKYRELLASVIRARSKDEK